MIMVFPHPHKFGQIPRVETFVHPISQHQNFSMSLVTFYPVCACLIFGVQEFLRMINSNVCIPHFVQLIICLPTVTMYNSSFFVHFSIMGNKVLAFLFFTGTMKTFDLSLVSLPPNTHSPFTLFSL